MDTLPVFLEITTKNYLARFNSGLRGGGQSLELGVVVRKDERNIYLDLRSKEEKGTLVIPRLRRNDFGNLVIGDRNDRAVCPFMIVLEGKAQKLSYEEMVQVLVSCNLEELFPRQGKRNGLDKILHGFHRGRGRLEISLLQRFLNLNLFNALPLCGTPMQDWAMNLRMMIFDPSFDKLGPADKLEYQREKNRVLCPWSSIGLSDGAAATKNYILQTDLRSFTAFGRRHHAPIRNLYSTLGMKGPEAARIVSQSAADLEKRGIVRGGWNWLTVFLDLPSNFEDQILVDVRHAGKQVEYDRGFVIYGKETVMVGDRILKGRILGINEDETPIIFDIDCDHAVVSECKDSSVPLDGRDQPVRIITLKVSFSFKEGVKITNQHGNKGIVALRNLGTARVGERDIPIDVIVSAKSVQRRRNFGQLLEAMFSLLTPERLVVADDVEIDIKDVESLLVRSGLPQSGAFHINTQWGEFDTLCGWVHWGVTKTPEEQLWEGKDVWTENQRGLRVRGSKFSPIEFKALTTLLGPGSSVVEEILSHQQGTEEVRELLGILDTVRGNLQPTLPIISNAGLIYLPAGAGTFFDEERLVATVADETMYPHGCYLQLPFKLQIRVPLERWKEAISEGIAVDNAYLPDPYDQGTHRTLEFDKIRIPSSGLRQPWKHPTGRLGLSDIASSLNQILEAIDRLAWGEIKPEQVSALVFKYLHMVSRSLSLKSGKISTYLMSVRYPWSSKATASLGENLEPNWVEIHRDMARDLRVSTGDYVLMERFPCLGFMSTRIQRVKVTSDPECKYVIRVSGNSLGSMNLDFDGDVIYIMSFHTEGAKAELRENFHNPHPEVAAVIERLNGRKQPITRAFTLQEMEIVSFPEMTPEEHAELNATSLSVKLWTGPVIALCYALMRIVEGRIPYTDRGAHINVEVFLDMVGNSVFSQKHGTKSLREECVEAVCLADVAAMVKLGFPAKQSQQLCDIIRLYAAEMGLRTDADLREHYQRHVAEGRSSIINLIIRKKHRAYFATRANLHPVDLLEHLESEPVDLVSHLIRSSLSHTLGRRELVAAG